MKGDFTRFTHDRRKHYTRVLKQQGRVDVDADWNELAEILTDLERTEAIDVIGRCGVPEHSDGFRVDRANGALTISPGRLYVDGIQCSLEADQPVPIESQPDLPSYTLPDDDGVYLVYADVWERHVTYVEDPDIREVALGGPDTATRIKTICQVRLHWIGDGEIEDFECQPFPAQPNTGRLAARTEPSEEPSNPCVVPAKAGYRGLENRLYRVEIHDDGRDDGKPTCKWSRDNGSVVLPIATIDASDRVTVQRLGHDEVLTVKDEAWIEIHGDETDLAGGPGTLAQVQEVDSDDLEITLTQIQGSGDLMDHAAEGHLKLRRWDHRATDEVPLQDGAVPIPGDWYELEDGVQIRFDADARYDVGDYWVIPARTREGDVLWPQEGANPAELARLGVEHHYCTLALVRRNGGVWEAPRDCRSTFPPLTEVDGGSCCSRVEPGEDIQQAIDRVVGEGGGSVCLCRGVHQVRGPLWLRDARNVHIRGEGTATVLRFHADANQTGGLMIESSERVTIEDLFIAGDDVPALIAVRHNQDAELNRTLTFRRLTLLNLATSDTQTSLPCGIRLAHAMGVLIDECRIAAEAGVLGLWGNRLPDLGDSGDGNGGPPFVEVDFEDPAEGAELHVGGVLTDSGVAVKGETFYWSSGQGTDEGFARVESGGKAGGSGKELQVNNINLRFGITTAYRAVRVSFWDFGGNTNLRVNGELRNAPGLIQLDGETIGGVRVRVTETPAGQGMLRLDADTAAIEELVIGGQELWIDDVTFRGGEEPQPPALDLDYGHGVTSLHMHHARIRFEELGVFSCLGEGWMVEECDVRSLESSIWDRLPGLLEKATEKGTLPSFARVLSVLEALFDEVDATGRGIAIAAFLWRDSTVRESILAGSHGIHVWWWIRGAAVANEVRATDTGLFAMWPDAVDWRHNRVTCNAGVAMGFAGCHRVRIEANRLDGSVGVTTVSLWTALDTLAVLTGAATRSYGETGDAATLAALWIFTEVTIELMGLRALFAALQSWVEANQETTTPVSVLLAERLRELLGDLPEVDDASLTLPVIHLRMVGNDVTTDRRCVALDDFLPLGSIVLRSNRLHTVTGQAVRLEANRLAANGHLVVFLFRALLELIRQGIDDALAEAEKEGDDPELATVLRALGELLGHWQMGSETFLELDFRIESNSIRSLLTAIELNLFEVAILDNHITLQERPVRSGDVKAVASVFGVVTGPARNELLAGAAVRVRGNGIDRSILTDRTGGYRIHGLPAGAYTVRASRGGHQPAVSRLELAEGEQVEHDLELGSWQFSSARVMPARGYVVADSVIAKGRSIRAGSNPEIGEIITELSRSEALEPLAEAMREGAHSDVRVYSSYLLGEKGPLDGAQSREAAAAAVVAVGGLSSDAETEQLSGDLGDALRANDQTALGELLPSFVAALQGLVDSRGILARGIGCRIVGNQVLVPADIRPETEALGGIQISVSYLELFIAQVLGQLLLEALGGSKDDTERLKDPLLGITDTLVDNNEVSAGVGHGISIQGVPGLPDALLDLRIRDNQVRGVAGAGILSNEHAYVVGAEITGNHVVECGRSAGFGRVKGGIVVHTAAACSIHGNHVERCGAGEGIDLFGIEVDTVYGAQLTNNELRANGAEDGSTDSGGMQLLETYGAVAIRDNLIAFNRGRGLTWINSARAEDAALLPDLLMELASRYLRTAKSTKDLAEEEQASVQDNVLKSESTGVPLFNLLNLTELTFGGNTCRCGSTNVPLGEVQSVTRGIISSNLLNAAGKRSISIKKLSSGVILGNVGNKPMETKSIGAEVEEGFNVPPSA